MIRPAALTMRCRVFRLEEVQLPYHTVMQLVRMLLMVPRYCSLQFAEEVEAPVGLFGQ